MEHNNGNCSSMCQGDFQTCYLWIIDTLHWMHFSILNALHCALFAFVEFVAGSDICKFGDWGVWGVCNSGSQQRIRKVSEMMMKMMKLVIIVMMMMTMTIMIKMMMKSTTMIMVMTILMTTMTMSVTKLIMMIIIIIIVIILKTIIQVTKGAERGKCQKKAIATRSCH